MVDFRKCLKPGLVYCRDGRNRDGYRGVLRAGRKIVRKFQLHTERIKSDSILLALEDAEMAMACDDGSLMAEELTQLANAYCSQDV